MEIISSDSRQIFKKMDIGTDKIPLQRREKIPHHLIDIIEPNERFTAGEWKNTSNKIIPTIHARDKTPFIVGGTGLYIDTIYKNFSLPEGSAPDYAYRTSLEEREKSEPGSLRRLLKSVDPEEAEKHHPNSLRYIIRALEIWHTTGERKSVSFFEQKPEYPILMLGLRRGKEETNLRIN
jgi:tRNA dimethylallyltransferase